MRQLWLRRRRLSLFPMRGHDSGLRGTWQALRAVERGFLGCPPGRALSRD
ncbi:hypothetical protein CCHR01_04570 [Colletotrichum chrysophilum]|uniref:Uncharacterized protein n=1 Tax=Colletotrichum chrysophilum TaxID=1836956 RepID=A0AAD9AW14_9PEZI|nr:hypothetical protein CCHR01_04570 [Colletotrichum chrysophilum]